MDKAEFNTWIATHQKAYPALAEWFAELPDQKGTLSIWYDAMQHLGAAEAEQATMRMVRGVEPLVAYKNWHDTPRFMAEHVSAIKREDRRFTPRQEVDGNDTYRCADCRDTGIVIVFSRKDVKAARDGSFNRKCVRTAARHCTCEIGNKRYAGLIERKWLEPFAPEDIVPPRDRVSATSQSVNQDLDLILAADASGAVTLDEWVNEWQ